MLSERKGEIGPTRDVVGHKKQKKRDLTNHVILLGGGGGEKTKLEGEDVGRLRGYVGVHSLCRKRTGGAALLGGLKITSTIVPTSNGGRSPKPLGHVIFITRGDTSLPGVPGVGKNTKLSMGGPHHRG